MPYRERRIYSGAMLEIERRHCTRTGRIVGKSGRTMKTCKQQEKINLKNTRRRLVRVVCENFTRGDYHITLTLANLPATRTRRQKLLEQFLRRLRTYCRRATGEDLRYICVREDAGVRTHWHLLCQKLPLTPRQLEEMWGAGRVGITTLDGNPDYGWLARYLTKQEEGETGKKRWSQSKNLRPPFEPPARVLNRKSLAARPKVPADYYVLSHYRWANCWGYEGEYIVAIRYDRRQQLPAEILAAMDDPNAFEVWRESGEW